jgi:pimeloyl-ACP methyl ester carboxylesterase
MRITHRRFSGRSTAAAVASATALVALVSLGCNDNPASPGDAVKTVPSGISPYVSDPGLNYNDTWVSATEVVADTTVVNTNQSFVDPYTDQQTTTMTVGSEPQSVDVLAGYGYDEQVRVTSSYATANASETQVVQQVGDGTGDVDQSGTASADPLEVEPMADLGTMQYAQIDPSSGGGGTMSCDNKIQNDGSPSCQNAMTRVLPGQIGPSLVRQDGARMQVVQSFAATPIAGAKIAPTGPRLDASANGQANGLHHSRKLTRDYEKHDSRWLLKHVLNEETIEGPQGKLAHRQHFNFTRLESFQNPSLDSARAVKRAMLDTESVVGKSSRSVILPELNSRVVRAPEGGKFMVPCDDPCGGGGGGGGGGTGGNTTLPDPPAPDETVLNGGDFSVSTGFSGPTVVLQHGFDSDARTFERMQNWIASDMTVTNVVRHTLFWKNTYEDQASQLHVALRSADYIAPDVILVGHSNGGMISRYLGRHPGAANESGAAYYYAPLPVRGVITIGTPHLGVPAVKYAGSLNTLLGVGGGVAAILCWFEQGGGCQQVVRITTSGVNRRFAALQTPVPVLNEMWPTDSYHNSFNAQPESFLRYGIQSYSWRRWQLWRIYGDSYCYSNATCGGPAFVKKADRTYHHDVSCSIVGFFTMRWSRAAGCAADGAFLMLFDNIYRRFAEPNPIDNDNYGDGIVPGWSQRYPNIPGQDQFPVHDGPSHVGETKEPRIGAKVEVIMAARFNVTRTNFRLGY